MEIMKQLYDVSSIIDRVDNLTEVRNTYSQLVPIELGYRNLNRLTEADVLKDTYDCALNICCAALWIKKNMAITRKVPEV